MLDPDTDETRHVHLGDGSRLHGVIIGPDGNPWVTDGGLNALVKVGEVWAPESGTDHIQIYGYD